jgi:hypothetical protein
MDFAWPDPISLVADVITFIGVPTLAWSLFELWQDRKRVRDEELKARQMAEEIERRIHTQRRAILNQGCVDFADTRQGVTVNLVPFEKLVALPRPGDFVMLPGETRNGQNVGAGEYEVERVSLNFEQAPEITGRLFPAVPSKIMVYVRKKE